MRKERKRKERKRERKKERKRGKNEKKKRSRQMDIPKIHKPHCERPGIETVQIMTALKSYHKSLLTSPSLSHTMPNQLRK